MQPHRDDRFPLVLGTIGAAVGAQAIARQVIDGRRSRRPRAGQELIETAAGSSLAVRYRPAARAGAPLVVFENSLVAVQDTDDATAFRGLRPVAATPAAVAWAAAVVAAGGVGAAIGDAVD